MMCMMKSIDFSIKVCIVILMGAGCMGSSREDGYRGDVYREPELGISIVPESEQPAVHHGIGTPACGYAFGIQGEDLESLNARYEEIRMREEQEDLYEQFEERLFKLKKFWKKHDIDSCILVLDELETIKRKVDLEKADVSAEEVKEIDELMEEVRSKYD
jgi:hypothetical protein